MELLLNIVWVGLATIALLGFVRKRGQLARHTTFITALLALMCALVLLFPVVSASDDLHPTQAVLEDATKRIQRLVAPEHHGDFSSFSMLPVLLAIYLLSALVVLQVWHSNPSEARVISLSREPVSGRSP